MHNPVFFRIYTRQALAGGGIFHGWSPMTTPGMAAAWLSTRKSSLPYGGLIKPLLPRASNPARFKGDWKRCRPVGRLMSGDASEVAGGRSNGRPPLPVGG